MIQTPTHLFVYGTLLAQAAHPMGALLQKHAEDLGSGSIQARLYVITEVDAQGTNSYPGAVPSAYPEDRVHGHLFHLTSPKIVIPQFNEFEACTAGWPEPYEFELRPIDVRMAAGDTLRAAAYLYAWDTSRAELIASGRFDRAMPNAR